MFIQFIIEIESQWIISFFELRFIVPYFNITDHLKKHNYEEDDAAYFISVIGIFNTIGMISLGYIGDKPWLHISKTYSICLVSK